MIKIPPLNHFFFHFPISIQKKPSCTFNILLRKGSARYPNSSLILSSLTHSMFHKILGHVQFSHILCYFITGMAFLSLFTNRFLISEISSQWLFSYFHEHYVHDHLGFSVGRLKLSLLLFSSEPSRELLLMVCPW